MVTALIVEDHPEQAELVARILHTRNYQSIIAPDGETGLQSLGSACLTWCSWT